MDGLSDSLLHLYQRCPCTGYDAQPPPQLSDKGSEGQGQLALGDARRLLAHLRASLAQTTYLEG